MGRMDRLASDLGSFIIGARNDAIYESFFQEVSHTTYKKYFKTGKPPYLREGKHGFYWKDAEDGTRHYVMVNRKRWKYKKGLGGKRAPMKKDMRRQVKLAARLSEKCVKEPTEKGCKIVLSYEKPPKDYHGTYEATYGVGDESVTKTGKMNFAEKEILSAIKKWSESNGLKIKVKMEG